MYIKELELPGLELVDPNADYSGAQTIFIDFDGANGVSYDNDALNIHIGNLSVAHSGLTEEEQFKILTDLNTTFANTGAIFTVTAPVNEEYSTIYVGGDDSAFFEYGSFRGLAEAIDVGNQIKNDVAFVFSKNINTTTVITETIVHETGHLLGFEHEASADNTQSISSYALSSSEQVTLKVVNNFENNTNYFSANYSDDEVWLYFLNTTGSVSYIDTTSGLTTVTDASAFKLSTVQDGTFTITNGPGSSKLFAALGNSSPFAGTNGPGVFDTDIPYSLIEWTVKEGANDNVDISYEDTFAFPTTLRVKDSGGVQTDKASFKNNTTGESFVDVLKSVMPTMPTGPTPEYNAPESGDAAGWGPLVPTVASDSSAKRWVGSSKYWPSGQAKDTQQSMYAYAPSFNDYLGYLQTHETILFPSDNSISGWYLDYSGDGGYSFYLSVTGTNDNYGLQIHDIRGNAGGAAPDWTADPTAGTAYTGTITIAANNANVSYPSLEGGSYNINGNWTDVTLYSGASLLNGDFESGPIVTGTDDFASGGAHKDLNPTIIASLSASIATGLLGNSFYTDKIQSATDPGSTMYWFNTLPRDEFDTKLFDAGWANTQKFYDPFWETMADYTNMQGYLSPFNDRWSNFSPDFTLANDYSIEWELGVLPLTKMASGDFNGDGKSDILFNNGSSLGYYANGEPSGWASLGGYSSGWEVAGSGSFTGNGTGDILFSNGFSLGYYANGEPSGWVSLGGYSSGWEIAGLGDFEGNGKDDILFNNGNFIGYYADGLPSGWKSLGSFSSGWEISGCADFNSDNKDDILFSDGSSLGYYSGGEPFDWVALGGYSSGWKIAGLGDFTGNGKDDILFSNSNQIGYYTDGKPSGWVALGGYSSGWEIKKCADFNGNGKADILFADNTNSIGYYADGLPSGWVALGGYSSGWEIVVA